MIAPYVIAQQKSFVDFRKIRVEGGKGGNGCMSFLSLPRKEFAGPDGGNGGNGGHVIFQGNRTVTCHTTVKYNSLKYFLRALLFDRSRSMSPCLMFAINNVAILH